MVSKILVVEDEESIAKILKYNLDKDGFRTFLARDGEEGLAAFRKEKPDLTLLDIMLPKMDGFEVCRMIRQESTAPVIFLTAKKAELDKVLGLELGADDFISKPFGVREALARIKAVMRRYKSSGQPRNVHRFGVLQVDFERYEVKVGGKPTPLTPREFVLLRCLLDAQGRALSREDILAKIWPAEERDLIEPRTIDQHITRLRGRLGAEAGRIVTVKNLGYRFRME